MKTRERLEAELSALLNNAYTVPAWRIALDQLPLLLPPEKISTTECAVKYRWFRLAEGEALLDGEAQTRPWDLSRSPYIAGIQDALDNSRYRMVIVVGAERGGKSVGGENYLFKRLKFGPVPDTIIYMKAGSDLDSYGAKEFSDIFTLHYEDIGRHVAPGATNNKIKAKKIKGRLVQLLPANDANLRQREAALIVATEIDGWVPKVAIKAIQEIRGRQKSFGKQAKAYIESHPDMGWTGPIASGWKEGTKHMLYWQCPHCDGWSTAHQLAPNGMRAKLYYRDDDQFEDNDRADRAAATAALECPHNGCLITDEERYAMIDGAVWIGDGQSIDADGSITGTLRESETASFWFTGLNVKRPLGPVAREHLEATLHFQRTRKPDRLKRWHVKTMGEAYEGASGKMMEAKNLRERFQAESRPGAFARGICPEPVRFIIASLDQGTRKFDVSFTGFDLDGRSWLIDRVTIKDNGLSGPNRSDIRSAERIEDWMQIRARVLRRVFPLQDEPAFAMPVACLVVDTGGGAAALADGTTSGGTWKAREFARRMAAARETWGGWSKVKLIKGQPTKNGEEVQKGRPINVDERGNRVEPEVLEHTINPDKLRTTIVERLAVDDGGPGQCHFADGLPKSVFEELCGEVPVDGKWERRGPNETLDLAGYAEAGRILLNPERADVRAALLREDHQQRPLWARPVPIEVQEGGAAGDDEGEVSLPVPVAKKDRAALFARLNELNRG